MAAPVVAAGGLVAGALTVALVRLLIGSDGRAVGAGVALVVVAALSAVLPSWAGAASAEAPGPAGPGRPAVGRALGFGAVAVTVALVAWTGADDPQLSWFGPVVANGERSEPTVAITFDDGPSRGATLQLASILEEHGARGTFFVVGKAVDDQPAAVAELADRGHMIANHSYHHDSWRWLDPRYPELERTQAAVERATGLCPAYYRPPHGQRTPFVGARVASEGMRTVMWDTSGADWRTEDPGELAARIRRRVRPGSIVLLHDGLDGVVDADRSVVVEALPLILDGLERRGLRPVRLDDMIGGPAYRDDC
jgi:peptidoglycan/xylan/chitin deacetylase (PgdA/CDA1 family)